ncbi:uncharacterized protein LACBIDRAFT_301140 [Laccaria bicolor S238N-H82]|uniref:Predicted protein n=1 Tax=Laccaria bicolor (strain S238N-H82 / ATCC MYA-4686) TaxID=486041 RepID=B0CRF5_LACBS|nr:uncharacterized protein LACBIDRAFT_301140 [Laccaria bicolor S238N-H82]EDR15811.1 predicted protein [Laccaria bicolor S238N-H82]|eukprot:XP_001874019.1 predicted protein [Laccaria bicolor S238N-H82]
MDTLANIPVSVPIHHVSSFDFDDAFNDSDDTDVPYIFSPDAIREEFARSMPVEDDSWEEIENAASTGGFFDDSNTSVSTLDINSDPQIAPESPMVGSALSAYFSQISLSTPAQEYESPGEHPTAYVNHHPHPNVVVNASEPPPRRVHSTSGLSQPIEGPPSNTTSDISAPPILVTQTAKSLPLVAEPASHSLSTPQSVIVSTLSSDPPGPSVPLTEKPQGHRRNRSAGPTALEKVRSKTRPSFLPPKPRQEDDKHMADWQHMMKLSRTAAEKRRKALQERRLLREKAIEESLHIWETEVIPDWRVVFKKPSLRKLWWRGIPTKLRASMWEKAVGNPLALNKDHYRTCLSRAKRALASGVFPQTTLDLIERDISTTLPALHIFHPESGPLYGDLKDMLSAWVVSRSDEGLGYTFGAAKIAAMMLINLPNQQAFIVMRNLLERHCMRSFFGGDRAKEDVEAYYRIFDTLLADGMPKIYFNFKQHQISPASYLPDWLIPLFLDHLPFEACARVWDVLLLEGDSFLYRASLGILGVLEPRLFFPEKKELLELLKGENKAALDVAKREGRPLDGGRYEIYGVDEETLWERIDHMNDWWKESTWTRLIQRELPDL